MADSFQYCGEVAATRDQALLVLYNDESIGTERTFSIHRCDVRPIAPTVTTTGTVAIKKITALSEGVDVPIVKMVTSASSLPDEVKLRAQCMVTEATGTFRAVQLNPYSSQGLTLRNRGGYSRATGGSSELLNTSNPVSAENLTLAEGEGVALVPNDAARLPNNASWYADILLNVGGSSYMACLIFTPTASGFAGLALMNESGSGVSVEVIQLNATYMGDTIITSTVGSAPSVRFARVNAYSGGETITPVVRVSETVTPSELVLKRNQLWAPLTVDTSASKAGFGYGDLAYPEQNAAIFRKIGTFRNSLTHLVSIMGPGVAGIPASEFQASKVQNGVSNEGAVATEGITIRAGEGFAVIVNNATCWCGYTVDLEFTHTRPPFTARTSLHTGI